MAYAVKCHKCCAIVMALIQTGAARLWRFNWRNSDAIVQGVVTDLRCKTVRFFEVYARSGMTSAPASTLSR